MRYKEGSEGAKTPPDNFLRSSEKNINKAITKIRGKSPPGILKNANLATLTFKSGNPVHLALFTMVPFDCSSPKTWV